METENLLPQSMVLQSQIWLKMYTVHLESLGMIHDCTLRQPCFFERNLITILKCLFFKLRKKESVSSPLVCIDFFFNVKFPRGFLFVWPVYCLLLNHYSLCPSSSLSGLHRFWMLSSKHRREAFISISSPTVKIFLNFFNSLNHHP